MKVEEAEFNKHIVRIKKTLSVSRHIPYYYTVYKKQGINIDSINSYAEFKNIPMTTKQDYRDHVLDFIHEDIISAGFKENIYKKIPTHFEKIKHLNKYNLDIYCTSGSTGEPLSVIRHFSDTHNAFFVINLHRKKICPGIFNYPYIWVSPTNPTTRIEWLGCKENFEQLNKYGYIYYLYKYNDTVFGELFDFIVEKNLKWIVAAPSVLSCFAEYLTKNKKESFLDFLYIECQSEYLFDWQKEIIKKVFKVTPTNLYASNEVQFIAVTCLNGNMHIVDKNVFVELVENQKNIKEVVVTTLSYNNMPLIRYKIGDYATWENLPCNCGNNSPIINLKQYRFNDLIAGQNGERFEHWIVADSISSLQQQNIVKFWQYQVIQEEVNSFTFKVKAIEEPLLAQVIESKKYLKNYFEKILGYSVTINMEVLADIIPNDPVSGKFKSFISKIKM